MNAHVYILHKSNKIALCFNNQNNREARIKP